MRLAGRLTIRNFLCLTIAVFAVISFARNASAAAYSSIVIDAADGRILYAEDAFDQRFPASLTKMMTAYMTFEAVKNKKLRLNQRLTVSSFASRQEPSSLGLRAGQTINVEDALLGIITKSANDAAVVLAEAIAGTEARFAQEMTKKARALGMRNTVFRNASGLPDPEQVTTAHDMAVLALALLNDYPNYYRYFATAEFRFNSRAYANHNRLLGVYEGMDGIKTGFTRASGFNLVASAVRNGERVVAAVFGGTTAASRNQRMEELLDKGFALMNETTTTAQAQFVAWPGGNRPAAGAVVARRTTPAPSTVALPTPQPSFRVTPPSQATGAPLPDNDEAEELPSMDQVVAVVSQFPGQHFEAHGQARAEQAQPQNRAQTAPSNFTAAVLASADNVGQSMSDSASVFAPRVQQPEQKPSGWGVQVGAFGIEETAQRQAKTAASLSSHLASGQVMVAAVNESQTPFYRARVVGLDEQRARAACSELRQKNFPCLVLTP